MKRNVKIIVLAAAMAAMVITASGCNKTKSNDTSSTASVVNTSSAVETPDTPETPESADKAEKEKIVGSGDAPKDGYELKYASLDSGFLALRSEPVYDDANKIGEIHNGNEIYVISDTDTDSDYLYCYVPKLGMYGYATSDYIVEEKPYVEETDTDSDSDSDTDSERETGSGFAPTEDYEVRYAKVEVGYVALRSEPAFSVENELGKLNTGDEVYLIESSVGSGYAYCYAVNLGMFGYAMEDCLVEMNPNEETSSDAPDEGEYKEWTVNGYSDDFVLSVMSAPSSDSENKIGEINNGGKVYVYDKDSDKNTIYESYWYVYVPSLGQWGYVESEYIFS